MENVPLRGEIYYAELNPVLGSEQGGTRPVLIIQNDVGNFHSDTVIIAAITNRDKIKLPTHLPLKYVDGLTESSVLLLEQIRTIDKQRLGKRIGTLTAAAMGLVDGALVISLGLKGRPAKNLVLTLCKTCMQSFENAGEHRIYRTNSNQNTKERCMLCSVKSGYDYEVIRKCSVVQKEQ